MERKIGEIFEYKGEWYQCVEGLNCRSCCFYGMDCDEIICNSEARKDDRNVAFKKLEKVGEPYAEGNSIVSERMFQKYRTYEKNFFLNERDLLFTSYGDIVSIEIKQKQEDMEENKLNLKPFNLEAARSGKPVCTRDGRKARIICFDKADERPIVALISDSGSEFVYEYLIDGRCYKSRDDDNDLMMLPEKKEGWVNVYRNIIYKTKEEAFNRRDKENYLMTIKVGWEE